LTAAERDQELLAINQAMLECVVNGDWNGYASTCDSSLSCFEAETNGVLAEGLAFHRFYFPDCIDPSGEPAPVNVTMARPHVRWISDGAAVVSYTRLTQRVVNGEFLTSSCCETRVWKQVQGTWKQVHVHRS
jgi:calcium/calmodulin-dependent protein kinase (CaM kinase) II